MASDFFSTFFSGAKLNLGTVDNIGCRSTAIHFLDKTAVSALVVLSSNYGIVKEDNQIQTVQNSYFF